MGTGKEENNAENSACESIPLAPPAREPQIYEAPRARTEQVHALRGAFDDLAPNLCRRRTYG